MLLCFMKGTEMTRPVILRRYIRKATEMTLRCSLYERYRDDTTCHLTYRISQIELSTSKTIVKSVWRRMRASHVAMSPNFGRDRLSPIRPWERITSRAYHRHEAERIRCNSFARCPARSMNNAGDGEC